MSQPKEKSENPVILGGINSKASPYASGIREFRDINNMNFSTPGSLTKRPGTTLYVGATVSGRVTGGYEFEQLSGASYHIVTANTTAYTITNTGYVAVKTGLANGPLFDFVTFVDRMFACNGTDFFKFDGSNSSNVGLPNGMTGWGVTAVVGGGLSGLYIASFGYLNDRGYHGPAANGITISLNGSTFGTIGYYGLSAPSGFGITAIALYRTSPNSIDLAGTTYIPAAGTTINDTGFPLTTRLAPTSYYFTMIPRYIEIYNNQAFYAGFSSMPSSVAWSQIGEPEGIEPDFDVEFRTNDGDRVTGMKTYNGSLVVTKERSFHRITGDNPDNFLFQEISDQYGCLSNRAMVTFENKLWFLDSKGIVEYDSASFGVISNKIEPIFDNMNIAAARENAVAAHVKQYNEIWFAIPCDGATYNNCIIVFDYDVKAWTVYKGNNLQISSLWLAKGQLGIKSPFFGNYTGAIFNFGISLMGDNGKGITCSFDSGFLAARGQTTESMYRRFYLDVDPVLGVTQAITTEFKTNYGTTIQASRTMYQNPFQSRVDFGLSAKSIQVSVFHVSATLSCKINGFAFESRFQRPT